MPSQDTHRLTPQDFVAAFGSDPSDYLADRIEKYEFDFRMLSSDERDSCIRKVVEVLTTQDLVKAGDARLGQWESGWGAHLKNLEQGFDISAITPGYFGKYPIVRWQQEYIAPVARDFEYKSFSVIQDWLFDKFFRDAPAVYEFGCGTGHNLFRARDVNPTAELWGLDWTEASQQVIARVKELGGDDNIFGRRFNLVEPDASFDLKHGACIYTAASLEQIGNRFEPFIEYLLAQKPKICVHIEPMGEFLDESNLLDYLSLQYFKQRNYLTGFVDYLGALAQKGRIRILEARRTSIGSFLIDGYSVVVWSPVD